jgi:hypothetical protein
VEIKESKNALGDRSGWTLEYSKSGDIGTLTVTDWPPGDPCFTY